MSETDASVLVIEDDELIKNLQKNKLKNVGYQVDTAGDGLQAWSMLKENDYNLALIDMFLPKLDGFQILKNIQAQDIPVKTVVVSSISQDRYKRKAYQLGADAYLTKPFESSQLVATVRQALEG